MKKLTSTRALAARVGLLIVVLAFAAMWTAEPAWAQAPGRVQGRIVDAEGNGLAAVKITATNPDAIPNERSGESSDGGRWALVGLSRGEWTFLFELEGFISYEMKMPVSGANRNPDLDVTLNPMPTDEVGLLTASGAVNTELFEEGNNLFGAGDYAGAIAQWQQFLLANPDLYAVHGNIGNAHRELGDVAAATSSYNAVLASEPGNTMANYNLGEMHAEAGEIEEAMPYFEKVVEAAPDDPAVYYNVAELYFSQREMEAAISFYQRATEVDPAYLPAYMQLGFAYVNSGDIPNAVLAFEKYIELAPADDPQLAMVKDVLAAIKSG